MYLLCFNRIHSDHPCRSHHYSSHQPCTCSKHTTSCSPETVPRTANSHSRRENDRRRTRQLPQCPQHGQGFLLCWVLKVTATATVATMYSKKEDSMTIPLTVHMWHKKTEATALLDSGATHNFIDKQAVTSLGLGTRVLPCPLQVNNVDSTINSKGSITQFCNLWIRQGTKNVKLGFYIANLGSDRIILGHPWFKLFNPSINWRSNQLEGEDITIETAGYCAKTKL
jgi:hypothetical protein